MDLEERFVLAEDAVSRRDRGRAFEMPAAEIDVEPPEPLFRSTDDWAEATRKLIAYRRLDDDDEASPAEGGPASK